jgi:hypothetical protein
VSDVAAPLDEAEVELAEVALDVPVVEPPVDEPLALVVLAAPDPSLLSPPGPCEHPTSVSSAAANRAFLMDWMYQLAARRYSRDGGARPSLGHR